MFRPQFRGPAGNSLTVEKNLPAEWGEKKNVQWKYKIPGRGWSAPIVSGGRVFVTTAVLEKELQQPLEIQQQESTGKQGKENDGYTRKPPNAIYRWEIHCLDHASGKLLWKAVAIKAKPRIPTHSSNTYASETPVTDGKRIYAYFGMMGVVCYDFNGQLIWKKDLGAYPTTAGWGTSSPIFRTPESCKDYKNAPIWLLFYKPFSFLCQSAYDLVSNSAHASFMSF